jgi:hypothetical protein
MVGMKDQKPAPNPDDIELHPDAWERFVDAVKRVARQHRRIFPKSYAKNSAE